MKLSEFVAEFIVKMKTKHVFLVTGGAIVPIIDSIGKKMTEGKLEYVCVQHEQAGAMAAEAYSRFNTGLGVVLVTSGPGATNLLTGICGCWFDSIPALFISGQVNTAESIEAASSNPRQVGFQETDIVSIVKSVTKFSIKITDPNKIRFVLEQAVFIAQSGRPGPVLVDIPVNLQLADIDVEHLKGFEPPHEKDSLQLDSSIEIEDKIRELITLIKIAERPVIILGSGVRIAGVEKEAVQFIEQLEFPFIVSWGAFDIVPHNHKQFAGHFGVYGNRGANFSVQNSDLIITLGSRLDTRQTGSRVNLFARAAKKVMIDIDRNEIMKGRGLSIDVGICTDLKTFFPIFHKVFHGHSTPDVSLWVERVVSWKKRYPAMLQKYYSQPLMNPYAFMKILSDMTPEGETIIVDEGGNLVWTMQSWEIKNKQRLISTFGNSPMGYALPAAIGASLAQERKQVLCIDGDGGFQMNIQELQTVFHYNIPLKIFILNNHGYGIIKMFQERLCESRYEASGRGYSSPDFVAVAQAYGIKSVRIVNLNEAKEKITYALAYRGPILCEVEIDPEARIDPKLEFGRPLEDMHPYLSNEEFFSNMIIPPLTRDTKKGGWRENN